MCVTIITLPKILSAPQTAKTSWLGTSSSAILATPETGRFVLVKTSQEKNQQKKKLKHLIQGLTAVVEKQKKKRFCFSWWWSTVVVAMVVWLSFVLQLERRPSRRQWRRSVGRSSPNDHHYYRHYPLRAINVAYFSSASSFSFSFIFCKASTQLYLHVLCAMRRWKTEKESATRHTRSFNFNVALAHCLSGFAISFSVRESLKRKKNKNKKLVWKKVSPRV